MQQPLPARDTAQDPVGDRPAGDCSAAQAPSLADVLRRSTAARIAMGHSGGCLRTASWLDFRADHAAARDAIQRPFDADALAGSLRISGVDVLVVTTRAEDLASFLRRPDLGRRLTEESRRALALANQGRKRPCDLAVIVSSGLSPLAVETHAAPLIAELRKRLPDGAWTWSPVVVAPRSRVALQDEIGEILGAELSVMLIGERPGLGSPDSLGAYLTYRPQPGRTDAERNCVSNIRRQGLGYAEAADTLAYLITQARVLRVSGVALKDDRDVRPACNLASV